MAALVDMVYPSSVQLDIARVSAASECRDINLNTRRDIPYLQAANHVLFYFFS